MSERILEGLDTEARNALVDMLNLVKRNLLAIKATPPPTDISIRAHGAGYAVKGKPCRSWAPERQPPKTLKRCIHHAGICKYSPHAYNMQILNIGFSLRSNHEFRP